MALEVRVQALRPAPVGATWIGEVREWVPRLGVAGYAFVPWHIDAAAGVARTPAGNTVQLSPFLGGMGVAPAEAGVHPTRPPRRTGGNLDCRDLTVGSSLFLPIEAAAPCSRSAMGMARKVMGKWVAQQSSALWSRSN